jgi:hypothetical protein
MEMATLGLKFGKNNRELYALASQRTKAEKQI